MKIQNLLNHSGLFYFVGDYPASGIGDGFEEYFTTYEEALHEADLQWVHKTEKEKAYRKLVVGISNTFAYPDDYNWLTTDEKDFVEPTKRELTESIKYYSSHQHQQHAEKLLADKKAEHAKKVAEADQLVHQLGLTSEVDILKHWRDNGYKQPTSRGIAKIKKETGLSWRQFQKIVENL